jgi:hypothetical protein
MRVFHYLGLVLLILFLIPDIASADNKSPTIISRELSRQNAVISRYISQHKSAPPATRRRLESFLISELEKRRELISEAIINDPGAVLDNPLPDISKLPSHARALVETPREISGKAQLIIHENFDDGFSVTTLAIEEDETEEMYDLNLEGMPAIEEIDINPGDKITIAGVELGMQVAGRFKDLRTTARSSSHRDEHIVDTASGVVEKKALVLLANFENSRWEPMTVEEVRENIFSTTSASVRNAIRKDSYGQWDLTGKINQGGDVYGWFTITDGFFSRNCKYDALWRSRTRNAARSAGINTNEYQHYIYVFALEDHHSCSKNGHATESGRNSSLFFKNDKEIKTGKFISTVNHELGHNYGLGHAGSFGDEYDDKYSVMGNHHITFHHHGFHRLKHWLPETSILTLSDMEFELRHLHLVDLNNPLSIPGVRAIKIPCSILGSSNVVCKSNEYYYITANNGDVFVHVVPDDYRRNTWLQKRLYIINEFYHNTVDNLFVRLVERTGNTSNKMVIVEVSFDPPEPGQGTLLITSDINGTSEEHVHLTWMLTNSNAVPYTRFHVYRDRSLIAVLNHGVRSYYDTAAFPGRDYEYRVRSDNLMYDDTKKGWRKLSPPRAALVYPQGQAGEGIFVSAYESCGATHHKLYRTTSSNFHPGLAVPLSNWTRVSTEPESCPRFNIIHLANQNGDPGVDFTAEPGVQYYYWIEAKGENEQRVRSAAMPAKRLLTPPRNLSPTIANKSVRITFHTSNGATHYCLYRGRTNNLNAATRLTPCPQITCPLGQICSRDIIDNNPPIGANHYWITAATSSGRQNESAPSNPIQVTYTGDSTNNRTSSPNTIDIKLGVLSSDTNAPISGATVKFKQNGEIIATAQTREDGYTPCTTVPVNVLTSIDISRSGFASALDISIGSSIPNGSKCVSNGSYKLTPIPEYTLTVSKSGSGRIESGPAGINCGSSCSASFNQGQAVVLSAFPASGMTVDKWQGACAGASGSLCTVNMTSNKSASVTFKPIPTRALTISKSGTGEGVITSNPSGINCGSTCSASFLYNHMVTLVAHVPPGNTFSGWTGACSGTQTTCSVR